MSRLTKRTETGVAYMADPIHFSSDLENRGKILRMVDKLARYEDLEAQGKILSDKDTAKMKEATAAAQALYRKMLELTDK